MTTTRTRRHLAAVPAAPEAAVPQPASLSNPTGFTPRTYKPQGQLGKRVAEAMRIKLEIDRLQAELDAHKKVILDFVNTKGISRVDVGDFQVQRKVRHNWTYSVKTQNEMLKLSQLQRFEQASGTAADNPTVYVAFSLNRKAQG